MRKIKKIEVEDILGTTKFESRKFHSKTSVDFLIPNKIPYEKWPVKWKKVHYKEYPRFESVYFNTGGFRKRDKFINTLLNRRSNRDFDKTKEVELNSLGEVLYLSAGINSTNKETGLLLRAWPSAGARYPLDCYVLVNCVRGLKNNFSYHYNVKQNSLETLFVLKDAENFFVELTGQNWTKNASCIVVIASTFSRTEIKYGDRGYRYCLLDSGHLAQNIVLTSTYLGLKSCPIGGFSDKKINDLLDLDGENEAALYLVAIGK